MAKQKTDAILYAPEGFPYAAMIRNDRIEAIIEVATSDEVTPDQLHKKGKWEYWMGYARQWKSRVSPLPAYGEKIFSADTIDGLRQTVKMLRKNGVPEPLLEPITEWVNDKEQTIHGNGATV